MRNWVATIAAALGLMAACSGWVQAQTSEGIECDAFARNEDGSWIAMRATEIPGPGRSIKLRQGSVLRPGAVILGTDVAELLEQRCKSVSAAAPVGPAPQLDLSKLSDASGNIDIQRLSCGQLVNVYQEDAEFLLAWYSGWSNGLVKSSVVNMPRLKEGIHNVIVHCKANREKLVSQAIDFIARQAR